MAATPRTTVNCFEVSHALALALSLAAPAVAVAVVVVEKSRAEGVTVGLRVMAATTASSAAWAGVTPARSSPRAASARTSVRPFREGEGVACRVLECSMTDRGLTESRKQQAASKKQKQRADGRKQAFNPIPSPFLTSGDGGGGGHGGGYQVRASARALSALEVAV